MKLSLGGTKAPTFLLVLAILVLSIGFGCRQSPLTSTGSIPSESKADEPDPNKALFDQISSGRFQADAAVETIASALPFLEELTKTAKSIEAKQALSDLREILNQCGEDLAALPDPPASIAEVVSAFAKFDDQRLKGIEVANDCLHSIDEASGVLEAGEDLFPNARVAVAELRQKLIEATDDLIGTVDAFGGKVESSD